MTAAYRFLAWARRGLAAGASTADGMASLPGRAEAAVTLAVSEGAPVTGSVALYGPGDVVGIDPRAVLRVDPARNRTDAEPNYLASIEFDPPDLPWLFTPAAANNMERLRPWCVLVVVRAQAGVTLSQERGALLPVLEIGSPAVAGDELPDLAESWAWAHAQLVHDARAPLDVPAALGGPPAANLSRLICPRRLDAAQEYLACVVPAFDHGRQRGLGSTPVGSQAGPAWTVAGLTSIRLPVYHHWRFATGVDGDIESLARALRPVIAPPELGTVTTFLGAADPDLASLDASSVGLVVRVAGALFAGTPPTTQHPRVGTVVRKRVDAARAAGTLGPPLYGEWHQDAHQIPAAGWLNQANVIAANRIAAGLGIEVVRANQEAFVQAAWDQVGDVRPANDLLGRSRLAAEVGARLAARHLASLPAERFLQVAKAWQDRVAAPGTTDGRSVEGAVAASSVPDGAFSAAYRRAASAQRPMLKRAVRRGLARGVPLARSAGANRVPLEPVPDTPDGVVELRGLAGLSVPTGPGTEKRPVSLAPLGLPGTAPAGELAAIKAIGPRVVVARPELADHVKKGTGVIVRPPLVARPPIVAPPLTPGAPGVPAVAGAPGVAEVPAAVIPIPQDKLGATRFATVFGGLRATLHAAPAPTPFVAADLPGLHRAVVARSASRAAVARRTADRVAIPAPPATRLPLTGIRPVTIDDSGASRVMAFPELIDAMATFLDRLPGQWLLPSANGLPVDGATLVETNPPFVASFMAGVNHELNAELLWREYPTDRRGTPARRFWPRLGGVPDIPPLHLWRPERQLGAEVAGTGGGGEGQLVLLIRGRLLLRYPDIVIYAADGTALAPADDTDETKVVRPVFFGRIAPDISYAGFPLRRTDLTGRNLWFILQQQPAAPRFGFDVDPPPTRPPGEPPADWSDVAWTDLDVAPGDHIRATAGALAGLRLPVGGPPPTDAIVRRFGPTAGEIAACLLQRPVRVAIHCKRLLET